MLKVAPISKPKPSATRDTTISIKTNKLNLQISVGSPANTYTRTENNIVSATCIGILDNVKAM